MINNEGENSPGEILDSLKDTLIALPQNVTNLKRIGKRIWGAISKYADMPPVVKKIQDVVTHVTTLFHDIRSDVMNLYNVSGRLATNYLVTYHLYYTFKYVTNIM